jgi:transcriptional regulator with XRE-family HTH domain
MPLDTGTVSNFKTVALAERRAALTAVDSHTAGALLRAAREAQGRTLQQVAEVTRIRRAYLAAIEDMRPDLLPSRPFAVGYAKAYAKALGLDSEMVAERFRTELPSPEGEALRAPIGVGHEKVGIRYPLIAGCGAVLAAAVLIWNVAQRAVTFEEPAPPPVSEAPEEWLRGSAITAPVTLGLPTAAPAEQTTPEPYVTPGLEAFAARRELEAAGQIAPLQGPPAPVMAVARPTMPPAPPPSAALGVKPKVYGASAPAASVVFTARQAATLVLRRPDGSIAFARHLSAGDSYRTVPIAGLQVDVSDPSAFDVYVFGQFKGQLAAPLSSLTAIAS